MVVLVKKDGGWSVDCEDGDSGCPTPKNDDDPTPRPKPEKDDWGGWDIPSDIFDDLPTTDPGFPDSINPGDPGFNDEGDPINNDDREIDGPGGIRITIKIYRERAKVAKKCFLMKRDTY